MRSLLALSLLISLCGAANAATVHHAHRHAGVHAHQGMSPNSASSFAYAPERSPTQFGSAPTEAYYGASQGYAPGEKERFLHSLFSP
ncbi:hypothetical protein [Bradyrhizobium genosp. A]|uniref:hypothetical protein n=1 Tax=Bradyrhizobium genosp. A TaxID=83626 RepID=UPI003CE9C09F